MTKKPAPFTPTEKADLLLALEDMMEYIISIDKPFPLGESRGSIVELEDGSKMYFRMRHVTGDFFNPANG